MTIDAYHQDVSRDSHSSLQLFRESVERYAAIRIHKTMQPSPPTPAMVLGTALHCRVLEPDVFPSLYAAGPDCDKRNKAWKDAVEAADGKYLLTVEQVDLIEGMFQGIMRHRRARAIFEKPGVVEQSVKWTHAATGMPLKCRPDKRLNNGLIADIKTTSGSVSPEAWGRTVANFGYHRAAALYLDGCYHMHNAEGPFVHVVVSTERPHEVAVYEIGARSLELGRHENNETLAELAARHLSGDWRGRWSEEVSEIDLPNWYFRQSEVASYA